MGMDLGRGRWLGFRVGLKGLGAEGGWVSEMGGAVLNLGRRFVELTLP